MVISVFVDMKPGQRKSPLIKYTENPSSNPQPLPATKVSSLAPWSQPIVTYIYVYILYLLFFSLHKSWNRPNALTKYPQISMTSHNKGLFLAHVPVQYDLWASEGSTAVYSSFSHPSASQAKASLREEEKRCIPLTCL